MQRSVGYILAVVATACATVGRTAPAAPSLDRDEAAVYATVIDSVFAADGAPFVVVVDSTHVLFMTADEVAQVARGLDKDFPASANADFEARNRTPVSIPRNLAARTPIRTLRIETFHRPGDDLDESYARFRRDFAPADHFYQLSRPGFDAERRHAVVATGSACGSLCGEGQVLLLARGAHGWRVTARTSTWFS